MSRTLLVLCGAFLTACGGGSVAPSLPMANLVATGNLSVQGCQTTSPNGLFGCTSFSGVIQNQGPGCAQNVRGVTTTQFVTGQQIGSAGWTYGSLVRPNEQIAYHGTAVETGDNQNTNWSYRTVPTWDNVACP